MKNKKITVFYGVLIFLLFLLAVLTIVIPKVLSVTPYVISDDKMAPEYHKDGLVFVKDVIGNRSMSEILSRIMKIKERQLKRVEY